MPPCVTDVRCVGSRIGWARHYFSCHFTVSPPAAAAAGAEQKTIVPVYSLQRGDFLWRGEEFICNHGKLWSCWPGAGSLHCVTNSSSRRGTKDNCSSQQSAARRLLVTRWRIYLQSWETMLLLARVWVTALHPVPPPPRGRVPSTLPPQTRLELPQVPASVCAAPQHVLHVRGRAAQLRVVTTNLVRSRYHRYYRYYRYRRKYRKCSLPAPPDWQLPTCRYTNCHQGSHPDISTGSSPTYS